MNIQPSVVAYSMWEGAGGWLLLQLRLLQLVPLLLLQSSSLQLQPMWQLV